MIQIILNILSIVAGLGGAVIGITNKETWENNQPTKTGWTAIIFLMIVAGCQISIQLLDYQDKKQIKQQLDSEIKNFTGWISIGTYSEDKGWTCDEKGLCPYLQGEGINQKTKPEEIPINNSQNYQITTDLRQYKRSLPNNQCPPDNFEINQDLNAVLKTDWQVKILDRKIYPNCDGGTRVLLQVERVE